MYRRLQRPLLQSLWKRHEAGTRMTLRHHQVVPPLVSSFRLFSSSITDDSMDEETMKKNKERLDQKENEELMDIVEGSRTAEEAVDKILTDEKVTDIDERDMEALKKKYPDDLTDEELDKMFKDDLDQNDYLGIDEDDFVSGKVEEKDGVDAKETNDRTEDAGMDPPDPEPAIPPGEKRSFQAETRQLLDIVTHSLYTDKEVFLRELVSNASDALEKLRHMQASNQVSSTTDTELPLEIRIDTDEVSSTITITDTGVGMTRDELISNLGTIARSGSKNFIKQLQDTGSQEDGNGIIGKFGVGFYSAFMVGRKVEVRSRSATDPAKSFVWTSDGSGEFEIAELPEAIRQDRGSSLVIHLSDEHWEYASEARIEKILKRYSNFVNYPIVLNGKRVNTLQAIWSNDPKTVSKEEYSAFYKYIASAPDEPFDIYHFRADAPIDVKALFFIPSFHSEKYGMERMEPGVSLYSRKVLIENKSKDILPDWMRFVKGVVDSEDLPLSISREKPQDSALISKLRTTLVRKFIAHLAKMSKKESERYMDEFYGEYNFFLKEGVCQDRDFQSQLSKLLRFETSRMMDPDAEAGDHKMVSLDEYISRMRPEQKDIYYLVAPTRDAALNSPYLEAFEKAGVEVLLMFTSIDDFVMANLEKYEDRKLVSVESGDIDLKDLKKKKDDEKDDTKETSPESQRVLSSEESLEFCLWFKREVGEDKVSNCSVSERLTTSPAIVVDNESAGLRRMMRMVNASSGEEDPLGGQSVEINPKHPIIAGVYDLRDKEPLLAKTIAAQIFDNCLLAAGLMDDGRSMLPRLNGILESVVKSAAPATDDATTIVDFEDGNSLGESDDPKFKEDVIEADFVSKEEGSDSSDSNSYEGSKKQTDDSETAK